LHEPKGFLWIFFEFFWIYLDQRKLWWTCGKVRLPNQAGRKYWQPTAVGFEEKAQEKSEEWLRKRAKGYSKLFTCIYMNSTKKCTTESFHMTMGKSHEQPEFWFLLFCCPICNRYNIWSKGEVLPELNRGHRIYVACYSMVNTAGNIGKSVYELDGHRERKKVWNRGICSACLSS